MSSESGVSNNTVHLWRARLDHPACVVAAAIPLLSPEELRRAAGGTTVVYRRRVLARAALRAVIGRYTGAAPSSLAFEYGSFGKPRLAVTNGSCPHFNVSTAGDLCVIAVAGVEVGVDVEQIEARDDLDAFASRFFAPREAKALELLEGEQKVRAFFTTWTLKEALLKGRGAGLSAPLSSFSVSATAECQTVAFDSGETNVWTISTLQCGPGIAGAVALRQGTATRPTIVLRDLEADEGSPAHLFAWGAR